MKAALDYTVDDLKNLIVRAWESGLCRGRIPAPYVMEELEHIYRESIKHDKPWGFDQSTGQMLDKLKDALTYIDGARYDIKNLVKVVEDEVKDD